MYKRQVQTGVPGSTLEMYREALVLRREHRLGRGRLTWVADAPAGTLEFDNGDVRVIVNCSAAAVALPADRVVAAQSGPLTADGMLPVNTAVWLV